LTDVYFDGNEQKWESLIIGAENAELTNANIHYGLLIDETLKFRSVAMNLGADISGVFQFMYNTADSKYVAYKVVANGVELKVGAHATANGFVLDGYMLPVSAKNMADIYNVTVIGITADGTEYHGETRAWSIKQGAFQLLDDKAKNNDVKAMTLIANMLAYGAAAQKHFGYNLDNLATDGLKAEYAALIKTTTPEMNTIAAVNQTGAKVKFAQVSFNLAERIQVITMAVLAAGEVKEDYKAVVTQTHTKADGTVSTKEYTIEGADCLQSGTILGVYIDEMASNELRDEMTVTLYKGEEAVSAAYKFSPESVLKGMLASKTELVTAIMNYGDAAIAYFG
jgi:hypothetical protein